MKIETLGGAVIAAMILFVSNLITLFNQDPELTVSAISQAAWISSIGGALVAGLKDYQAISTRRLISSMRAPRDSRSPMLVGILAVLLVVLMASCANLSTSIGAAYVSIETAAETIQLECGNEVPGGPCRDTSMLDRGDVDSMKVDLQIAKDAVDDANRVYNAGESGLARGHLETAQAVLATLRTALEIRGIE